MSYSAPPPPAYQPAPAHPKATTVLVLGILGLVLCGVFAPFAWVMGTRVVREIDASGGGYGGREQANIGRILGIVGTVLLVLLVLFLILGVGLLVTTSTTTS